MFKTLNVATFIFVVFFSQKIFAESEQNSVIQHDSTLKTSSKIALKTRFAALLGLKISQIKATPLNGIVEIVTNQGLFYASKDGNYLIQGQLFSLKKQVVNLTEASLATIRLQGMAKFKDDMIIFPAKHQKYVITVFTDITCGYCRKLHKQIDKYNNEGITVRYLAYPRSGISNGSGQPTKVFKDMRSVWCSEDPKKALSAAFSGQNVAYRLCDKPVGKEFEFGRQVGVNGTPSIVLTNGMMIPGYQGPKSMLQILKRINKIRN